MKTSLRLKKIEGCGEDVVKLKQFWGLQVHTRSLPLPYYVHTASFLGYYYVNRVSTRFFTTQPPHSARL